MAKEERAVGREGGREGEKGGKKGGREERTALGNKIGDSTPWGVRSIVQGFRVPEKSSHLHSPLFECVTVVTSFWP